jgi:hypothetical protein
VALFNFSVFLALCLYHFIIEVFVGLLAARCRRRYPVQGQDQGFVVGPQLENPALEPGMEGFDTWNGGEKLPVKSGVVYLCF